MKESNRGWLRMIVKVVTWSGGGVFALLIVLALLPDSKGGGDEDLIIVAVSPVPERNNSYPELVKLAASLRVSPDEEKNVRLCVDDAPCKPEALAAVFARNAEPLRHFDAFRGKRFLPPESADISKLDYNTPIPKFIPLTLAATLSLAQARLLVRQGRKAEALERLVRIAEVGRALQSQPSNMITYMVGLNIRTRALTVIREALSGKPAPSPTARKDSLARLGVADAGRAGLKHALRMEYTLNANMITRLDEKGLNALGEDSWIVNRLAVFYFKRNRTREMLRQDFARAVFGGAGAGASRAALDSPADTTRQSDRHDLASDQSAQF